MKNLKYFIFTLITCFISLSIVKAEAVCVYKNSSNGDYRLTCTADNSNVDCINQSIGNIKFNFTTKSLTYEAFIENGTFKCPSKLYISLGDAGESITNISSVRIGDMIDLNNDSSSSKVNNNTPSNTYETDPEYIKAKEDADEYCDSTNFTTQDDALCEEARQRMNNIKNKYVTGDTSNTEKFDTERPCTGKVLGVFTTVGYVFFIAKILVPIILIVMGSIDFGKAVIASKDDEIKKSLKTLVIRAIAGVIIFFIPTLLNFVINVLGNNADDVFNGTFSDCTKCMFKPNQTGCKTLRGD